MDIGALILPVIVSVIDATLPLLIQKGTDIATAGVKRALGIIPQIENIAISVVTGSLTLQQGTDAIKEYVTTAKDVVLGVIGDAEIEADQLPHDAMQALESSILGIPAGLAKLL